MFQHRRSKTRLLSEREVQEFIDASKTSLTEELKSRYPIFSMSEFREKFQGRWAAVLPILEDSLDFIDVHLVAHDSDPDKLREQLRTLEAQQPKLRDVTIMLIWSPTFGRGVAVV